MKWKCPVCGLEISEDQLNELEVEYLDEETILCPNCGAEMIPLEEELEEDIELEVYFEEEEEFEYFY